jgi:hypothetical protein
MLICPHVICRLLLIKKEGVEVPTDLKRRELIEYGGGRAAMTLFDQRFREHLRLRVDSDPKYPSRQTYIAGQLYGRRTFGDNLGILGLISALGMILGEGQGVILHRRTAALHQPRRGPARLTSARTSFYITDGILRRRALLRRAPGGRRPP